VRIHIGGNSCCYNYNNNSFCSHFNGFIEHESTRKRKIIMYKQSRSVVVNQIQQNKSTPLSAVVRQLNQNSSFHTTVRRNGGHHVDFHRTPTKDLKTKDQVYEEEWKEFEAKIPPTPKFEFILAKLLGASLFLWLAYFMKENGAILFGLERPHWEHAFDDTDSEEDDDDWSDTDSDDDLELRLEYYTNDEELKKNPVDKKIRL
jgi:hypothetical protein